MSLPFAAANVAVANVGVAVAVAVVAVAVVAVAVAVRCAVKVPKTVEMWAEELKAANAAVNGGTDTKVLKKETTHRTPTDGGERGGPKACMYGTCLTGPCLLQLVCRVWVSAGVRR